eukprot:scaffold1112_cov92-Amphora_coffeaeformis.AAC.31
MVRFGRCILTNARANRVAVLQQIATEVRSKKARGTRHGHNFGGRKTTSGTGGGSGCHGRTRCR